MSKGLTDENVRVGTAIKDARERAHLTRSDVAERVGRTPQHIRNVENGHRSCPEPLALAIAQVLDIDPSTILRRPQTRQDRS